MVNVLIFISHLRLGIFVHRDTRYWWDVPNDQFTCWYEAGAGGMLAEYPCLYKHVGWHEYADCWYKITPSSRHSHILSPEPGSPPPDRLSRNAGIGSSVYTIQYREERLSRLTPSPVSSPRSSHQSHGAVKIYNFDGTLRCEQWAAMSTEWAQGWSKTCGDLQDPSERGLGSG